MFKNDFYQFLDQKYFLNEDFQIMSFDVISGLYSISDGHMEGITEVVYDSTYTPIKKVLARKFVITHDTMMKILRNGRDELKKMKFDFEYFYLYSVKQISNGNGGFIYEICAAFE